MLPAASSVGIAEIHIRALRPQALNRPVDGNRGARTEVLQMHQVHYVCSVQVSVSMCCFIPASPRNDGKSWGACYIAEATPPEMGRMPQNLHRVECTVAGHPAYKDQVELTWFLLLAAAVNVHT
jgi:hypothetical protein